MSAEEQRLINEAAVAVRRAASCGAISSPLRRALQTVGRMLEMYEDQSVPAARSLRVVTNTAPPVAVAENQEG
jgi:hypothetical protein